MKTVYQICLLAIFIIFLPGCEKQDIPVQITMFNIEDGLPNQNVRGLAEDNYGNIWISTNEGIALYDNEEIRTMFDTIYGLDRIVVGPDGSIWFGKEFSRSLRYRYDWNHLERVSSFQDLYASLEETERYYNTWYEIYYYHDNFWDTINIEHYPDSYCTVYEVLLDSNGDFWVTTPDYCFTGVYRYNGREWTDYNTKEIFSGEIGNSLYGLIETNHGDILISAGSHIVKFSDDEWSIYFDLNNLAEYRFLATMDLYADSRDNIWFPITDLGSFEGLLYSYNGKELNKFDLSPFPYSGEQEIRMVNCIFEDSKENIWVGTTDGLFKIVK